MIRHWISGLMACAISGTALASDAANQAPRIAALDAVIQAAPGFAGLASASRNGVTIHAAGYGVSDREAGTAHAADQAFRWASVSKMVTAILVFQEVDRGTIALDAPMTTYLTGSGVDNADRITVRQLLAHRSGLAEQATLVEGDLSVRPDALLEGCRTGAAEPGSVFQYNNCDTIILGEILEAVTGLAYIDLVNARLGPALGVTLSLPEGPRVEAYADAATREAPTWATAYGPSGGLYGTAADLLAIDTALIEGRLISTESLATMLTGDPASGYAALSVWSYEPDLKGCLGKTRLVERYGQIGGVQVRNFLLPDKGVAVVVYSNDGVTDFGEIWRGQGLSIDILRAAACG